MMRLAALIKDLSLKTLFENINSILSSPSGVSEKDWAISVSSLKTISLTKIFAYAEKDKDTIITNIHKSLSEIPDLKIVEQSDEEILFKNNNNPEGYSLSVLEYVQEAYVVLNIKLDAFFIKNLLVDGLGIQETLNNLVVKGPPVQKGIRVQAELGFKKTIMHLDKDLMGGVGAKSKNWSLQLANNYMSLESEYEFDTTTDVQKLAQKLNNSKDFERVTKRTTDSDEFIIYKYLNKKEGYSIGIILNVIKNFGFIHIRMAIKFLHNLLIEGLGLELLDLNKVPDKLLFPEQHNVNKVLGTVLLSYVTADVLEDKIYGDPQDIKDNMTIKLQQFNDIKRKSRKLITGMLEGTPKNPIIGSSVVDIKTMSLNEKVNLANDFDTSHEILRELAKDKDFHIRLLVAENPNIPEDVLWDLAADENKGVKTSIAGNPSTPIDVLLELSEDADMDVRKYVARVSANADDWDWTDKDKNLRARVEVAANPNTPEDTLANLAQDTDIRVRGNVAANPNTPVDVLRDLAKDNEESIRGIVGSNSNTPDDLLRELAENPNTSKNALGV